MNLRAIVFANGIMDQWPQGLAVSEDRDLVIAADGGLHHCRHWKIAPHAVVGDMDSADPLLIDEIRIEGVEIIRHPSQKDETDLALALKLALERGAEQIIVLGALGARWDMTLSNVLILAAPFLADASVRLLDGPLEVRCLRGGQRLEVTARAGDGLSLLPLPAARGVTLKGLAYPLDRDVLETGSTRGVSNVFTGPTARIGLDEGCLLLFLHRH